MNMDGIEYRSYHNGVLTIKLQESFGRDAHRISVPGGSQAVQRAFYGNPDHPWDENMGRDVTFEVKSILDWGRPLMAQNHLFGDTADHEKMLFIEAAIVPPPVSPGTLQGFIKALRAEYIENIDSAVGSFFDSNGTSDFEQYMLDPFEDWVRQSSYPGREEIIAQLAEVWGC